MNRSGPNEDTTADGPDTTGQLFSLVYAELRELAHRKMCREPADHTLQATDLVHEAYVRLAASDVKWDNRGHFFGAAAQAMRRILIERARRYARPKHGGGQRSLGIPEEERKALKAKVKLEIERIDPGGVKRAAWLRLTPVHTGPDGHLAESYIKGQLDIEVPLPGFAPGSQANLCYVV